MRLLHALLTVLIVGVSWFYVVSPEDGAT